MNINLLVVISGLGLFLPGFQVLSCEPTSESPSSSSTLPSPVEPISEPDVAANLPILNLNPLPLLSDAEIEALQTHLTQGIDTWFGLAGINKVPPPPPLTDELRNYQETWRTVNPDIVPFLGQWHNDEAYSYSLTIFPSQTEGEVCVLEFKPEWSLDIFNEVTGEYGKDIISEQILRFSLATVQDRQLRSSQIRSLDSAMSTANYAVGESYTVLFMSLIDAQNVNRVVALSSPPTLPSELPLPLISPVSQTLNDYGCITDL
ncbi:MAG: hypothetical protein VKJ64_22055 [Leptolyngbyaceae bacterium]|nr:hypothetical protein [Leptolyngbyaceae bacterium]